MRGEASAKVIKTKHEKLDEVAANVDRLPGVKNVHPQFIYRISKCSIVMSIKLNVWKWKFEMRANTVPVRWVHSIRPQYVNCWRTRPLDELLPEYFRRISTNIPSGVVACVSQVVTHLFFDATSKAFHPATAFESGSSRPKRHTSKYNYFDALIFQHVRAHFVHSQHSAVRLFGTAIRFIFIHWWFRLVRKFILSHFCRIYFVQFILSIQFRLHNLRKAQMLRNSMLSVSHDECYVPKINSRQRRIDYVPLTSLRWTLAYPHTRTRTRALAQCFRYSFQHDERMSRYFGVENVERCCKVNSVHVATERITTTMYLPVDLSHPRSLCLPSENCIPRRPRSSPFNACIVPLDSGLKHQFFIVLSIHSDHH